MNAAHEMSMFPGVTHWTAAARRFERHSTALMYGVQHNVDVWEHYDARLQAPANRIFIRERKS